MLEFIKSSDGTISSFSFYESVTVRFMENCKYVTCDLRHLGMKNVNYCNIFCKCDMKIPI